MRKSTEKMKNIWFFYYLCGVVQQARAVSRKRGCMPADSFVGICKCIARPNFCGTPACVKPPPRWLQCPESAVQKGKNIEKNAQTRKRSEQTTEF
jgi:hypothetical protein